MSLKLTLCAVLVTLVGCGADGGDDTAPPWYDGVSTLSGSSERGAVDGPRGKARFNNPVNVAYGPDGKLYVADFDNDRIRVVDATTGDTSTLIKQTGFSRPFGLAFGKDGTLWIATDNNAAAAGNHSLMTGSIWRVNAGQRAATLVTQNIGRPRGMVVLPDGRLALSDYMHHVIELFNPADQKLTVLAGTWDAKGLADGVGAAARFSTPYHLVLRKDGKLLVADFDNHSLRIVGLDGTVTTFSGGGAGFVDGAMASARWNHPQGVAMAANGDIYVTDLGNYRLRRITGDTTVETIAGNGSAGYEDSDDPLGAKLYGLEGLSLTPDATQIYLAAATTPAPFAFLHRWSEVLP
jgi:DNA-binding beta-propeller fold protein YncE